MAVWKGAYAYGHKAVPGLQYPRLCKLCGLPLTHVRQTNQPDQWRHPKRKR